jgi:phospholipid-binding lipoprotein MlaA
MRSSPFSRANRVLRMLLVACVLSSGVVSAAAESTEAVELESALVADPWERYNRSMHGFNNKVDAYVVRPLAVAYDNVTPKAVQHGVTNFFSNLTSPLTMVNQLLQGRPIAASKTLGRFAMNTTVGIGGIFDPADRLGFARRSEDFGQTLATWGWEDSRYLVLPLLGPRTLRDALCEMADSQLAPLGQLDNTAISSTLKVVEISNGRTRLFPLDAVRADALDDYSFVRDAWIQRRNSQIRDEERSPQK